MNQKERLLSALKGLHVDRPPFICPGGMMNMAVTELMDVTGFNWPESHMDSGKMAGLSLAASNFLGVENLGVPFCMTVEAEGMGAKVDMGTRFHEPSIALYPMRTVDDIDRISDLNLTSGRAKVCVEAVRYLRKAASDKPVFANLTGPISLATSLVEPLVFYRACIKNQAGTHRLMKTVTRAIAGFGDALIEAGADIVCIADPSASGELVGKKGFDTFAMPYINELVIHFRKKYDAPSIVHICGRIHSLGTSLSEIAAESVSVDACVSIKTLKQLAPSKIAMGNANTYLLSEGNPSRVLEHALGCLKAGTDILAPACGVSPKTPMKNIKSLSAAAVNWKNDEPD